MTLLARLDAWSARFALRLEERETLSVAVSEVVDLGPHAALVRDDPELARKLGFRSMFAAATALVDERVRLGPETRERFARVEPKASLATSEPLPPRTKRSRCTACNREGHNQRSCPLLKETNR